MHSNPSFTSDPKTTGCRRKWVAFLRCFSILVLAVSLGSCSLERKLAREFVEGRDSVAVMLFMTDYVIKTNLKSWEIAGFEKMTSQQQDSALYFNSTFLKEVDDAFLLSRFENGLQAGLKRYNIKAFTEEQLLDFLDINYKAYKVLIAQVEIEEDIYPYRVEEIFFDSILYYEDFSLNLINMNLWFEISEMNDPNAVNHLLYATDDMMDALEGRFQTNLFSGDVKFNYNYFPVKTEDIYTLAAMLGEKYAGYIYDYTLNEYIHWNFPAGERPRSYYTYDLLTRTVAPAKDQRFIFIRK